jgi:hypothetical protein
MFPPSYRYERTKNEDAQPDIDSTRGALDHDARQATGSRKRMRITVSTDER